MDVKTMSVFITLLITGNPVISQAWEWWTKMGLGKCSQYVMDAKKLNTIQNCTKDQERALGLNSEEEHKK